MSSIFRNDNEKDFIGGHKHITDVIKSDNSPNESFASDSMLWKHPDQDFNTKSTLIVTEGEVAILFANGEFSEVFTPGRYSLETSNYFFISRLRNMFSGGVSTYNYLVYFIRSTPSMTVLWGTQTPIEIMDYSMKDIARKGLGTPVAIKGNGAYRYKISDPTRFISALIGSGYKDVTQDSITRWFDAQMQSIIQADLSVETQKFSTRENEEPVIDSEIKTHLQEWGSIIFRHIDAVLKDKGISLDDFSIANLVVRDTDRSILWKQNADKVNAEGMMKSAYEELGTNYQQAKTFDVLEGAAKNPGSMGADLMGAGLGITMGAGLAQSMNPMMQDAMKNVQGASMKVEANDDDQYAELKKLKSLLDEGIITQDDFDAKKAQILGL